MPHPARREIPDCSKTVMMLHRDAISTAEKISHLIFRNFVTPHMTIRKALKQETGRTTTIGRYHNYGYPSAPDTPNHELRVSLVSNVLAHWAANPISEWNGLRFTVPALAVAVCSKPDL